jgi:hypothetical protein
MLANFPSIFQTNVCEIPGSIFSFHSSSAQSIKGLFGKVAKLLMLTSASCSICYLIYERNKLLGVWVAVGGGGGGVGCEKLLLYALSCTDAFSEGATQK